MKHIKKSMFISTVLMVVMLIAALSTATFAWYTSNSTVTAKTTTAIAAQSDSANITIGWSRGATTNSIQFANLQNDSNAGHLFPVVPNAYYHEYIPGYEAGTTKARQILGAKYTTSTATMSSGFIAGGLTVDTSNYDYRRVVNLSDAQVAAIVAESAYVHNPSASQYTNLTAAGINDYDAIYYIPTFAKKDSVDENVAPDSIITVSDNVYTYQTAAPESECYKVINVFTVEDGGNASVALARNAAGSNHVSNIAPSAAAEMGLTNLTVGTKVVEYYKYASTAYKNTVENDSTHQITVSVNDSSAVFVGYSGTTAATLMTNTPTTNNYAGTTNNPDIQAEDVTASYNVTSIQYNADNFAFLYKIENGGEATFVPTTITLTNEANPTVQSWGSFNFTRAAINNGGYFTNVLGDNYTPTAYITGNDANPVYNGDESHPVALITGNRSGADNEVKSDISGTYRQTFYVANKGTRTENHLVISIRTQGDNADILRVAVFRDGNYYGTLAGSNKAPTKYGTVTPGALAADLPTYKAFTSLDLGKLETGDLNDAAINLVVWYDGGLLNEDKAGGTCQFDISFSAASADPNAVENGWN